MLNGQKIWSSRAPFGDRAFGLFRVRPGRRAPQGPHLLHVRSERRRRHGPADRPARRRHRVRRDLPRRRLRSRPATCIGGVARRLARRDEHVEQRARDVAAQPGALPRARRAAGGTLEGRPATRVFADRVADAWIKAQAYRLHTFGTVTRLAAAASSAPNRRSPRCSGRTSTSLCTRPRWTCAAPTASWPTPWTDGLLFALGGPIYAGTNEIQRNIIAERLLGLPREPKGQTNEIRRRRTAARLRREHRRGARRRRRARRGARVGRRATPVPAARSGRQLADLGVTALWCPRSSTGSRRTLSTSWSPPNGSGYWGVPGPVTESIAVAPVLLADDERSGCAGVR